MSPPRSRNDTATKAASSKSKKVSLDEPFEAAVAGNPDEVGDALPFAKLVEAGSGKSCITPEPKLFEPGPVAFFALSS